MLDDMFSLLYFLSPHTHSNGTGRAEMETQSTTKLTAEDNAIRMSRSDATYRAMRLEMADSTDYRAMRLRMASPAGCNESVEEIVCLELSEGITFREWCDGCAAPAA